MSSEAKSTQPPLLFQLQLTRLISNLRSQTTVTFKCKLALKTCQDLTHQRLVFSRRIPLLSSRHILNKRWTTLETCPCLVRTRPTRCQNSQAMKSPSQLKTLLRMLSTRLRRTSRMLFSALVVVPHLEQK